MPAPQHGSHLPGSVRLSPQMGSPGLNDSGSSSPPPGPSHLSFPVCTRPPRRRRMADASDVHMWLSPLHRSSCFSRPFPDHAFFPRSSSDHSELRPRDGIVVCVCEFSSFNPPCSNYPDSVEWPN